MVVPGRDHGIAGAVFDNVHDRKLTDGRIRGSSERATALTGRFPDSWCFVRCGWEPSACRLLIFVEHGANKMMPVDTGKTVVDSLTYADEQGGTHITMTRLSTATTCRTRRCG